MTSMPARTIDHLLAGLPVNCRPSRVPADLVGCEVRQITLNSNEVGEGDAFLALPGAVNDGRKFIGDALARGAVAVLAESEGLVASNPRVLPVNHLKSNLPALARHFYADPSARMTLVAVTGTNGKTSVADFTAQILRRLGLSAGSIGTLGARLNDAVVSAANTTPDVVALNRQLAQWVEQGVDHVAMEASSHALDQDRLAGLNIHTAIFTNLSRDHLDYHGTEQAYAEAKLSLFRDFDLKRAIFNADDPVARQVRTATSCPSMGISLESAEADVFVQILSTRPLTLRIHGPFGTQTVETQLSGTFNAFNLTAAIMAAVTLGYSFSEVIAAAEQVRPVAGRMQVLANQHEQADAKLPRVVVDYAHTPDALNRALAALRPETQGQLWVVFGCGGDRDRGKRSLMGTAAQRGADRLVVTSDNPRSESPELIVDDIFAGLELAAGESDAVTRIVDRRQAIHYAITSAGEADTVLVAGKGHEDYQEVQGVRMAFSDSDVALSALANHPGALQ